MWQNHQQDGHAGEHTLAPSQVHTKSSVVLTLHMAWHSCMQVHVCLVCVGGLARSALCQL